MNIKPILSTLFALLFIASCGPKEVIKANDSMPTWITIPPQDTEEYFYAPGQAESSRQGMALTSAEANARVAMAAKLKIKVSALQKSFTEEVQSGPNANYAATFSSASEQLVNSTMSGTTRDRAECEQLNPKFTGGNVNQRCYVLVRMPVGQARTVLENALSKDEELYTKFKASKAFEELENKLHEDLNN